MARRKTQESIQIGAPPKGVHIAKGEWNGESALIITMPFNTRAFLIALAMAGVFAFLLPTTIELWTESTATDHLLGLTVFAAFFIVGLILALKEALFFNVIVLTATSLKKIMVSRINPSWRIEQQSMPRNEIEFIEVAKLGRTRFFKLDFNRAFLGVHADGQVMKLGEGLNQDSLKWFLRYFADQFGMTLNE